MFGIIRKIVQNHDSGELFYPPFPNPLVCYVYDQDLRVMFLIYTIARMDRKNIFIKLRVESNLNPKFELTARDFFERKPELNWN